MKLIRISCKKYWSICRSFLFQTIEGMMTLLEIENRAEARHVIVQIDESIRTLPPNVMLYMSLKGIIGVIFNVIVLFFLILTGRLRYLKLFRSVKIINFHCRLGSCRHKQAKSCCGIGIKRKTDWTTHHSSMKSDNIFCLKKFIKLINKLLFLSHFFIV